MSAGRVSFRLERRLYTQLVTRAHEEGISPDEVLEAWIKRAVRQEETVLPKAETGNVRQFRRQG